MAFDAAPRAEESDQARPSVAEQAPAGRELDPLALLVRGRLDDLTNFAIDLALRECGSVNKAAERLGLPRSTLYHRLKQQKAQ